MAGGRLIGWGSRVAASIVSLQRRRTIAAASKNFRPLQPGVSRQEEGLIAWDWSARI